ncbi:hypothetical protein NDU88_002706 [Pleurodeles waltl]|uniref:Uncharacterized protein n=1 Tax=Pleurodeles waltl TaxID=8319 RepID=A0AAV7VDL2_PLEWA|nr:hypothetical protein NDU88_002706 [Pleurodeles waltl]
MHNFLAPEGPAEYPEYFTYPRDHLRGCRGRGLGRPWGAVEPVSGPIEANPGGAGRAGHLRPGTGVLGRTRPQLPRTAGRGRRSGDGAGPLGYAAGGRVSCPGRRGCRGPPHLATAGESSLRLPCAWLSRRTGARGRATGERVRRMGALGSVTSDAISGTLVDAPQQRG